MGGGGGGGDGVAKALISTRATLEVLVEVNWIVQAVWSVEAGMTNGVGSGKAKSPDVVSGKPVLATTCKEDPPGQASVAVTGRGGCESRQPYRSVVIVVATEAERLKVLGMPAPVVEGLLHTVAGFNHTPSPSDTSLVGARHVLPNCCAGLVKNT